ncbi:lipocalin family protein [bacterium]|nr:lipocalin family protein [bacterium]RQV97939.1 MAG: hypothetical protein EH221_03000 [bacterium]
MKSLQRIIFMTILTTLPVIFIMNCSKDSSTSSKDDLIGTWELIELIVNYEGIPADLIQYLGLDITLTVREDETYTLSTTRDGDTQVEHGTWKAGSKTITINPDDGDPKTMDYSIDGNTATLKTTLPNVVDPNDEDLMSNIPADMFNTDGTLKDTAVKLIYQKIG